MKTKDFKTLIKPIAERLDKEKDPYLMVHFSREDNYSHGVHEGMDKLDAMIVIKELVKKCKINETLLLTAINNQS